MTGLYVTIRNPEGIAFEKSDVQLATFPGRSGEFGVMVGHMNYGASLKKGIIKIDGVEIPCDWGMVNVTTYRPNLTRCEVLI